MSFSPQGFLKFTLSGQGPWVKNDFGEPLRMSQDVVNWGRQIQQIPRFQTQVGLQRDPSEQRALCCGNRRCGGSWTSPLGLTLCHPPAACFRNLARLLPPSRRDHPVHPCSYPGRMLPADLPGRKPRPASSLNVSNKVGVLMDMILLRTDCRHSQKQRRSKQKLRKRV